ncbi:MAG: sugar phosphate isomerase/epimerase [Candidatus Solibacter usitatus]|nr:sugar phosphate isomerase/epimerase [Candidatus Solibacter usitatus]
MHPLSRRALLSAAASPLLARGPNLKIGVMDGVCGKPADPAAVQIAARLGFDGLQVTLGKPTAAGRLVMADPERQAQLLAESKKHKLPLVATYIDILHVHCLKNDRDAVRRAIEGIEITRRLNAGILMLVFFGKCALESPAEMDAVVGPLKDLAPEAEKAGVILGFENTITAEDDLRILAAVNSKALKIYYDIGNATNLYHVDPAREIRTLKNHICQFHFKDHGYLGAGNVDVRAALAAIRSIEWKGHIVLETGSPSREIEGDLRRNREYLARLL